jgi:hypothetical protein
MRSLFGNMDLIMRYLLLLALLFVPAFSLAYNPTLNTTTIPYEVMTISGQVGERAEYLGELTGYPQMYEFTIGKEEELTLTIVQKDTEVPLKLSLIAVKENTHNAGVSEVGRLGYSEVAWNKRRDSTLAITLLEAQEFVRPLTAGTYRVEVSTPDNFGKYMLVVGKETVDSGYFKLLGDVRTIQSFFGMPFLAIILSSAFYANMLKFIVIVIFLTWFAWYAYQAFLGNL